jgi:glyoxylase-like metal-dependent hydrolase (beta-lactamase superfamily II)
MSIQIRKLTLGPVATNCYVVGDADAREALVIDPVDNAPAILNAATSSGWTIKLIVATHAHFDHVLASKALKEATGAPFIIHEACVPYLKALPQQGLMFGGPLFPEAAVPDRLLADNTEEIKLGAITLETLYTPGHAPGHISYFIPTAQVVFCGDALFQGSIGRTDLPGGDYPTLLRSIFEVLLPLGDEVIALSGHGDETTLGQERRTNPFLLDWRGR